MIEGLRPRKQMLVKCSLIWKNTLEENDPKFFFYMDIKIEDEWEDAWFLTVHDHSDEFLVVHVALRIFLIVHQLLRLLIAQLLAEGR